MSLLRFVRRLLGHRAVVPADRDRADALRSAQRADALAARLREAKLRRNELTLRLDVRRGPR